MFHRLEGGRVDACIPPFEAEEDSPVDAEPDANGHERRIGDSISMKAQQEVRNEVQHEIPEIKISCGAGGESLRQLGDCRTERDEKDDGGKGVDHGSVAALL